MNFYKFSWIATSYNYSIQHFNNNASS